MSYTKKTLVMFLVSALLGGGAWYLNTTGIFGGLSSSVLTFGTECTEESIKEQASTYRKTLIKLKKAESIRETLEATITSLQSEGKTDEVQKEQKTLRILIRQMGAYNSFIKAYVRCQKSLADVQIPETSLEIPSTSEMGVVTVPVVVQTSSQPERQTISQSVVHTSDTISTPSVTMPSITNADEDIPETTYTEIPPTTAILETTTEEIIPETTNTSETTETTVPETTNMSEITSAPADSTQPSGESAPAGDSAQ